MASDTSSVVDNEHIVLQITDRRPVTHVTASCAVRGDEMVCTLNRLREQLGGLPEAIEEAAMMIADAARGIPVHLTITVDATGAADTP